MEESRRKEHQGSALDPGFYGRTLPLAGFCVGYVWTGRRAVTSGIPTPIWNAFSGKNMLKSIFVKDGQRNSPPPLHGAKAFPLGGRCPSAHTGADEGAIDWPNGAEEGRRWGDRPIFLQGKVGYRIAPSSVTFGDSFPPRGSLWVVQPYPKKRPKSGHADGRRNSPTTGTMRHNRQNERVETSGP